MRNSVLDNTLPDGELNPSPATDSEFTSTVSSTSVNLTVENKGECESEFIIRFPDNLIL